MQPGSGAAGNAATPSREEPGPHSRRNRFEVEVIFHLDELEADTIYRAVLPEARDIPSRRASVEIGLKAGALILRICAADPVALRAALNSFMRFIDACLQSLRSLDLLQGEFGNPLKPG
ncbi:MAG: KEOPS complex subunit Pcc1 [Nitrososphaerota archaeon]